MTTKLYKFQKKGVRLINKTDLVTLLADEQGLGKTIQTLFAAWMYLPDDATIVVVCPAIAKEHWRREASKHLGMRTEMLFGRKPKVRKLRRGVYLINYDILGDLDSPKRTWAKLLNRLRPKLVIADEGHYLSNPNSQRSRFFWKLADRAPHKMVLSGTPLTNRPAELWPIVHSLWPNEFPSQIRFLKRYCKPEFTPWGVKYTGATRLKELHRRLRKCGMIRRRASQVLKDLPPLTRTVIPVELKNRKEYDEAEKDFGKWLRKTFPKKAAKSRKAERLTRYGYMLRLAAKLKMPHVHDWIDSFLKESDGKLLTFGIHKFVVQGLEEKYAAIATRIDGSVTKNKRYEAIDKFVDNKKCRLCFANQQAGGVVWSAKGCSTVLHVEFGWRPGDITQAEKRAHGIGRGEEGKGTSSYFLVAANTIEEDLCKLLQKKQRIVDSVLDGKRTKEGLDIYDALEKAMLRRIKRNRLTRRKR